MNKQVVTSLLCFFLGFTGSSFASEQLQLIYTFGNETSFRNIANEFEKSTGIHLTAVYSQHEELKANLMMLQELKTLPDVVIIPADHVGLHNLINYSAIDPSAFKVNISQRIWKSAMSDGVIYGVPISQGNHLVLYYNKNLVKTVAKNWDDIVSQKKQFDSQGVATIGWDVEEPFYFLPFISAYGGWPIIDGKVDLNTQPMVDALHFYNELRVKQVYPKDCDYSCMIEKFTNNKLAYHINGEWQGASFAAVLGENLGVSAIPSIGDKKMRPAFSTYVIAFPSDGLHQEKRELVIKLVDYLQSSSVQQQMWKDTGAIPVETVAFNAVHEQAQGYLKEVLALMLDTEPLPADESMSFVWDAMGKGIIRYNRDLMNASKTAEYMQQLAEKHLRNLKKKTPVVEVP